MHVYIYMYVCMYSQIVPDSDVAGPFLIAMLLGAAMLLRGKVAWPPFSYIYLCMHVHVYVCLCSMYVFCVCMCVLICVFLYVCVCVISSHVDEYVRR